MSALQVGKLNKTLNVTALTFYGIGMILGAGIYSVIGAAAAEAKDALWLSFALSSVVVLLTALSYAELATMFPQAGAEYVYLGEAFPRHRIVAFVTSSFVALSGCATAATVSLSFAGYFNHFLSAPAPLVAFAILATAAAVAIVGIQESSWVNMVFTTIEATGLVLFIYLGAQSPEFGEAFLKAPHLGVFSGAALVFFSFLGFENIANLAEEAKEPEKSIPRAILLSVGISTIIYVGVGLAAVALVEPAKLAASASPLATAAAAHSKTIAGALGGIALFATANTALISLIAVSRIFFSMARKKDLPKVFTKTLAKRKSPWTATLLAFAIGAVLLPLGKVELVASVSSLSALLAFVAVNVALITLRFDRARSRRPFRVPLAVGKVPVLPLMAIFCLLGLMTQFETMVYLIGVLALVACAALYIIFRRLQPA